MPFASWGLHWDIDNRLQKTVEYHPVKEAERIGIFLHLHSKNGPLPALSLSVLQPSY
jgi:hypothetical protein